MIAANLDTLSPDQLRDAVRVLLADVASKSAEIATIAASAIQSTSVGTRGVNAMPYCMVYCPNRSIRAGAWTWSAL